MQTTPEQREPFLPAENCSCEICTAMREAAEAAAAIEAALRHTNQQDATTGNVGAGRAIVVAGQAGQDGKTISLERAEVGG